MIEWLKRLWNNLLRFVGELSLKVGGWAQSGIGRLRPDGGQTVAEYALVLLVVAAIAVAFLVWAKSSGKLDAFFDAIFAKLQNSVDPGATPAPTP